MQTQPGVVYGFGPFQVSAASGELLKNGIRVRLQEQPLRLLIALLETPGEVVSREELRSRLWADDTFVDFDSSLRVAVKKLREALDDDAADPRYIETIPKRGYRFLVSQVRQLEPSLDKPDVPSPAIPAPTGSLPDDPIVHPSHRLKYAIAAVTGIAFIAGATFLVHQRTRLAPLTDKDTLVLADFANTTGDPVFDGTLRQGLAIQLEQSPFLKIMDDSQVQQTMRLMTLPPGTGVTNQIAHDICVRDAAAATIDGSIAALGKSYVITLQAITCAGGETLAREQVQANDKEHVLSALGSAATAMRSKLGESRNSIQKFNTPVEQASTPSLEAAKAYSSGIQTIGTKGPEAAIPFFKRAIELDPDFASAYAYLGILATNALEPSLSVHYRTRAYELRSRTSLSEGYWIDAAYEKGVTGNIPRAIEACDLWMQAYPRAYFPRTYLAGAVLPILGQNDRALEEATAGIRLNPDYPFLYAYRMQALTSLNRFDEAKATYAQTLERNIQNPLIQVSLYNLAFAQNDIAAMAQQAAKMESLPRWRHTILYLESDTAAYQGNLEQARELSRRATDTAQAAGEKDAAAIYLSLSALREVLYGNPAEARKQANLALTLSSSRDVRHYSALTFAYCGDSAHAKALADELNQNFPSDTLVQFNYLPTLRARLALNKGDALGAIHLLEPAAPYEQGATRANDFVGNTMFPVFLRGEAYLAAHQGDKAAAEFQKIIDHRGLVLNRPIGALAHLGLARAYNLAGDTPKARTAYGDFATLWKDAGPTIPILRKAKVEIATLQH